jgi:Amino acid permease
MHRISTSPVYCWDGRLTSTGPAAQRRTAAPFLSDCRDLLYGLRWPLWHRGHARWGGYLGALLILAIIPFVWSLPTTLMIGELASAMPAEGGFYVWVRRAFGPFWGYQEAWLSLAASIFDMAIYPTLSVLYLKNPKIR